MASPSVSLTESFGSFPTPGSLLTEQQPAKVSFLVVLLKQIEGDAWFTWWFHHLPGPSILKKGHLCQPIFGFLARRM